MGPNAAESGQYGHSAVASTRCTCTRPESSAHCGTSARRTLRPTQRAPLQWPIRARRPHKVQVRCVWQTRRSVAQSATNFCLAHRRWSDGARPVAGIVPACSAVIDSTFSYVFIICSLDVHVTVRCCLQVRFDSSSAAAQNAQESPRALYPRLTLKGFDLSRTFTTHSVSPRALFTPVLGHSDHKTDARDCLGRSRESRGQHVRCGYCAVWTAGKPCTRVLID